MRTGDNNTFAKGGAFVPFLGGILIQDLLKSLDCSAAFQADDGGSIPLTRSNRFQSR